MVYSKSRKRPHRARITTYEPFESAIISQLLKQDDFFIDIGAHTGHYTLLAAKIVGDLGYVLAFEPEPTNFEILRSNVQKNYFQNVYYIQKAVSNRTSRIRLYLSPRNPGDHRIYDSHDGRQFIDVESTTLDDYFSPHPPKVDFIKLDIQGSEPAAIEGMSRLLQRNNSLQLATEFWPFGLKAFGVDPVDYLRMLQRYGFSLANINEYTKTLEPISDLNSLLQLYTPENNRYTNLLCSR